MSAFAPWTGPQWKQRGAHKVARVAAKKATKAAEEAEKRKVRARDKTCRWPRCTHAKDYRLECAHIVSKSLGGSNDASNMVLVCWWHHQGPESLHTYDLAIEPETERGSDGPLAFYATDPEGKRYLVAREVAVGVYHRD